MGTSTLAPEHLPGHPVLWAAYPTSGLPWWTFSYLRVFQKLKHRAWNLCKGTERRSSVVRRDKQPLRLPGLRPCPGALPLSQGDH